MEYKHIPVLLEEVLEYIDIKTGDRVVDCTLGGAGYTKVFSKIVGDSGRVFSFDLDILAIENAKEVLAANNIKNVTLINDSFHNLESNLQKFRIDKGFDAIVMDLGLSSAQLDDERRGFSFLRDSSLDMSFSGSGQYDNVTADIINWKKEEELERIIRVFGEERYSRRIAKAIVDSRQKKEIKTSGELLNIIKDAVPNAYINNPGIHFATRTFQALRIATNDELNKLEIALPEALRLLKKGGRLVIVSFHSLEDRIVKHFFKEESKDCLCPPELPVCRCGHEAQLRILTKKPVTAGTRELAKNPRARSAKLRAAVKI